MARYKKKLDDDIRCPLEYGLAIFGGKWKSRIICVLSANEKLRYSELRREMYNITDAVLAATLKDLIEDGIIDRKSYDEIPPRVEYMLTQKGKTVVKYAPIAYAKPDDYEARAQLMWAGTIADNATLCNGNQLAVFGVHGMEHELSAFYDITHGVGLAILTPRWMEYVLSDETAPRFADEFQCTWHRFRTFRRDGGTCSGSRGACLFVDSACRKGCQGNL